MARKVYMVDTENVSSSWRMMLADMTRNDVLYLFYTEHSPGIGYADFKEIMESEMKPELISCYPGKNGLDFQLVSYLGYLLKSAGKTEYIIISNDMGYDCVIHFWKEQGYKVSRMTVYDLIQRKKARIAQEMEASQKAGVICPPEASNSESEISAKKEADAVVKEQPSKECMDRAKQEKADGLDESTQEEKETSGKRGRKKKRQQEVLSAEGASPVEETSVNENAENPWQIVQGTIPAEEENGNGRKFLVDLLSTHDVDVDTVIEILRHGSPHQLQKVYTQMLKLFGHQTGVELYHVLKPHFPALFTYVKNGSEQGADM